MKSNFFIMLLSTAAVLLTLTVAVPITDIDVVEAGTAALDITGKRDEAPITSSIITTPSPTHLDTTSKIPADQVFITLCTEPAHTHCEEYHGIETMSCIGVLPIISSIITQEKYICRFFEIENCDYRGAYIDLDNLMVSAEANLGNVGWDNRMKSFFCFKLLS